MRLVSSSLGIQAEDTIPEADIPEVQQVHEKMMRINISYLPYLPALNKGCYMGRAYYRKSQNRILMPRLQASSAGQGL